MQPSEEHVNHAVQHLFAYLAGGERDDHLSHAILRAMFAYEVDHERERTNAMPERLRILAADLSLRCPGFAVLQ